MTDHSQADLPTVFICYSSKDEEWRKRAQVWLGEGDGSRYRLFVDESTDDQQDWDPTIRARLCEAAIAVVLLSADATTSHYIRHIELPVVMQRKVEGTLTVFPIHLKPHTDPAIEVTDPVTEESTTRKFSQQQHIHRTTPYLADAGEPGTSATEVVWQTLLSRIINAVIAAPLLVELRESLDDPLPTPAQIDAACNATEKALSPGAVVPPRRTLPMDPGAALRVAVEILVEYTDPTGHHRIPELLHRHLVAARTRIAPPAARATRLLVLPSDKSDDGTWSVQLMAGPHGAGTGPLEIAAHELCGVLDALAEQTAVDWGRAGLVEVYLPLLARELPVDAWEFDNAGGTEPLGAAVQLVVRSTERCLAPDTLFLTEKERRYHRQWRERLSDRLDAGANSTVVPCWCEDSTEPFKVRVSRIRESSANALCAIGMSQQDTEHRRDRLLPAFVAAAPTCVWSRDNHAGTGLREHLEPLVTAVTLGDLPVRVLDARVKCSAAAPNQSSTGHHLTLVIDHPDAFIDPPRLNDPQNLLPDSDETAT